MAALTAEEQIGKDLLFEYITINHTSTNIEVTRNAAYNVFSTLLQYPSLLSKYKSLRDVVQKKLHEFTIYTDAPLYLRNALHEVQELLHRLTYRSDYVE
jgi:hypothetical protein